jgi:hypothetical protein
MSRKHLRRVAANGSVVQKAAGYADIKIFNSLPLDFDISVTNDKFEVALKRCLNTHSFYSVDEFFQFKNNK